MLYANLKSALNYVGIYGSASSTLSDFITLNYPSTDYVNTMSIQVLFYYASIGTPLNTQYEIINV